MLLAVPKLRSCAGHALSQPVPNLAVEDGRRTHRAPALRAPGTARPLSRRPGPRGTADRHLGPVRRGQGHAHLAPPRAERRLRRGDVRHHPSAPRGRGRRPRVLLPRRRGVPAAGRPQRVPRARELRRRSLRHAREEVDRLLATGRDVILELEVDGAFGVRRRRPGRCSSSSTHRASTISSGACASARPTLRARSRSRLEIAREQLRDTRPVRHRDRQRRPRSGGPRAVGYA